jgi:predicted negative regulator of RcsB-dependent stress response
MEIAGTHHARGGFTMANEPLISPDAAGTAGMVGVIMGFLALVGVYWVHNQLEQTILGAASATAQVGATQAQSMKDLADRIDRLEKAQTAMPATTAAAEPAAAPAGAPAAEPPH